MSETILPLLKYKLDSCKIFLLCR